MWTSPIIPIFLSHVDFNLVYRLKWAMSGLVTISSIFYRLNRVEVDFWRLFSVSPAQYVVQWVSKQKWDWLWFEKSIHSSRTCGVINFTLSIQVSCGYHSLFARERRIRVKAVRSHPFAMSSLETRSMCRGHRPCSNWPLIARLNWYAALKLICDKKVSIMGLHYIIGHFPLGGVAYNSPEFLSRWFHYQFHWYDEISLILNFKSFKL